MGRITLYQQKGAVAQPRLGTGLVRAEFSKEDFSLSVGEGIKAAVGVYEGIQKNEDQKARVDMRSKLAQARLDMAKDMVAMEEGAELGAPGHVQNAEALAAKYEAQLMAGIDKRYHGELSANFADLKAGVVSKAMRFESQQTGKKLTHDVANTTENLISLVQRHPSEFLSAQTELGKLKSTLLASGQFSARDVDAAIKAESERLHAAYVGGLISGSKTQEEVDNIEAHLRDGDLAEGLSAKALGENLSFIETRRSQIEREQKAAENEASRSAIATAHTQLNLDMVSALNGDPEALQRIQRGDHVNAAVDIVKRYNQGLELLSAARSATMAAVKKSQAAAVYAGVEEREWEMIGFLGSAADGFLGKPQLDAMAEDEMISPKEYKSILSVIEAREKAVALDKKGNDKEAKKWWSSVNSTLDKLRLEKERLEAKETIHAISVGAYEDDKLQEVIAGLPRKYRIEADNAARTRSAKEETKALRDQKRAVSVAKNRIMTKIYSNKATEEDVQAVIDDLEEKFGFTDFGSAAVKELTKVLQESGKREVWMNQYSATLTATMAMRAKSPSAVMPPPEGKEKKMADEVIARMSLAARKQFSDLEDENGYHAWQENVIKAVGFFPAAFKDEIVRGLKSDDPRDIWEASQRLKVLDQNLSNLDTGLSSEQKEIAAFFQEHDQLAPETVMDLYKERKSIRQSDREARGQVFSSQFSKDNLEAIGEMELGPKERAWVDMLSDASDDPGYARAVALLQSKTKNHYISTGDIGVARSLAMQEMMREFGVSEVSGAGGIMRSPPEKVFGVPSLDDKGNAEWIREQFVEYGTAAYREVTKQPGAVLEPSRLVIKQSPVYLDGKPTYNAWYGGHIVLRNAQPDWKAHAGVHSSHLMWEAAQEAKKLKKRREDDALNLKLEKQKHARERETTETPWMLEATP